eukprot:2686218-Rhodomonas_salina.1
MGIPYRTRALTPHAHIAQLTCAFVEIVLWPFQKVGRLIASARNHDLERRCHCPPSHGAHLRREDRRSAELTRLG